MYNSIYPNYVKAYLGVNNKQITKKSDEDKNSQSSANAKNEQTQSEKSKTNSAYFPNGEKVAIDYTKRQINISQVLTDFKNTANAIGTPDEIKTEVFSYLSLIESQSQKSNPNQQIIQSNLKNASQILDEYITDTLKKPSKVVENWVDALLLHKIDYKSNVSNTQNNPAQTLGVNQTAQATISSKPVSGQEITSQEQNSNLSSGIYIPQDKQLKRMFIQAKKYAAIDNKEKALSAFKNTMDYADEIGDNQTGAIVHYEQGRLYDESNQIEDALFNYNQAAQQSSDNNIKAKAHIYMGKIYDDYVKFEPAVEHYCAAVSFAGEADNLKLQTQALSDLAQIHTNRYDKENAMMFMEMSDVIVNETGDNRAKGITYTKNAKMCEKLDDNTNALKYYGNSVQAFSQTESNENIAKNYTSAAEIMSNYGNKAKAKRLLSKAYNAVQQTDNDELKMQITLQIAAL